MHVLLVRIELVNNLFVGQEHAPAAVPGNMKIVEDLFGILAFLTPCLEFIPCCGDGVSTGETSNGYQDLTSHHIFWFNDKTFGTLPGLRSHAVFWLLSAGSR
jgi:hypothetical protein